MDPSARSQFRAICYRQTSARIGHAVAKASVMRLLGVPRLPLPQLIPSYVLAWNRHFFAVGYRAGRAAVVVGSAADGIEPLGRAKTCILKPLDSR